MEILWNLPSKHIVIICAVVILIALVLSWSAYRRMSVILKVILGFMSFSFVLLVVVSSLGYVVLSKVRVSWLYYEKDRMKEGAFVFLEKLKRNNETLLVRYSRLGELIDKLIDEGDRNELNSIFSDSYVLATFDLLAAVRSDGSTVFSTMEHTVSLNFLPLYFRKWREGEPATFLHWYSRHSDTVFLMSAVPISDGEGKLMSYDVLVVGVDLLRHAVPALLDMLKAEDVRIEFSEPSDAYTYVPLQGYAGGAVGFMVMTPGKEAFTALGTIAKVSFMAFILTLVAISLFFVGLASLYIRRPLSILRRGALRVGRGDFEFRLPELSKDDVGEVMRSFNMMLDGLVQRDREIAYRNSLLYSLSMLSERLTVEYHRKNIFALTTRTVSWVLENTSSFVLAGGERIGYAGDVPKQVTEKISAGEDEFKEDNKVFISMKIIGHTEGEEISYGYLVVFRDRKPFSEVEKEFLQSLVSLVSQACQRSDFISKLKMMQATDTLTGLFNMRSLFDTLKKEMSRARRSGYPISLIMFDVDNMRAINEKYGYVVGDDVLRSFGATLKKNIRLYDIPARYEKDEFALLLPNTTKENAKIVAKRVLGAFRGTPDLSPLQDLPVQARAGISSTEETEDLDKLVEIALERLKTAREQDTEIGE